MAYINLVPSDLTVGVGETKTVTIDTNGHWPYYTVIWDDAQEIAALDPFLPDAETIETTTIKVTGVSVGTTWFEVTIDEGQSARCNITVTAESTGGNSGTIIVENFTPSGAGWYYNITGMNWNTQKIKMIFDTSDVSGDDLTIIDIGKKVVDASSTELSLFIDLNKRLNCLALANPIFDGALGV